MASNLKRLQDRAAAIAARMTELTDVAERSDDQTAELRKLSDEADAVKADLEFENKLAAKEAELRAVVETAAPAKAAPVAEAPAEEKKVEIRHMLPHHTELRAFNDGPQAVEDAYRTGRWIRATVFKNADDIRWCRDHGVEARALSEGSNSAGGYLVPQEFAARVIRLVETYGTMPGACERVTLARDVMTIPKRTTGTTAYFVSEGGSITESDPAWNVVTLNSKKLAVACRLSSEVLEDSASYVNIADQVTQEFGTSLAFKIDSVGWNGNGQAGDGSITGIGCDRGLRQHRLRDARCRRLPGRDRQAADLRSEWCSVVRQPRWLRRVDCSPEVRSRRQRRQRPLRRRWTLLHGIPRDPRACA
jgi:HK97 family phage major capsid protein